MKKSALQIAHGLLGISGAILVLVGFVLMIFPSLPHSISLVLSSGPRSSSSSSSHPSVAVTGGVSFADPNLDEAIREAIGEPYGEIQRSDFEELRILNASNLGITTLEGIEQCPNLLKIDLGGNEIVDFSPLASLLLLEDLDVSDNGIREPSSLEEIVQCENLRRLNLRGNEIVDITPLAELQNISELDLSRNKIEVIVPLLDNSGLGQEDRIDLRFNPMDVGEESENRAAIRSLEARGATVIPSGTDSIIVFPDGSLEAAVRDTVDQQQGHLVEGTLRDVTELAAAACGITDMEGVQHLEQLQRIDLSWNEITDCSALSDLSHVYELKLQGNKIEDIASVVGMNGLTVLYLSANKIVDIDVDWQSRKLIVLDLAHNEIESIDAIGHLVGLRSLDVSGNQIADISALGGFLVLADLVLSENQIIDISVLSGLNSLREVDLADNQIVDISPLMRCVGLRGEGTYVNLQGNPLDTNTGSVTRDYIDRLLARGVDVRY